MSLEEKIEETPQERRGLMHHLKFAVYSIWDATLSNLVIPTRKRIKRESIPQTAQQPSVLEETIYTSAHRTIPVAQLVWVLSDLKVAGAFIGANLLSLGYEVYRTRKMKRLGLYDGHGKPTEKMIEEQAVDQSVSEPVSKSSGAPKKGVFSKVKSYFRSFGRFLTVNACSYALVASLAVGHYTIANKIEDDVDPSLVNFRTMECKLENGTKEHKFYMIGEVHYYNASSHVYMRKLVEGSGIDVLLSEGTAPPSQDVKLKGGNLAEVFLFLGITPIWLGAGWNYQGPSAICAAKEIPVVYLEKRYSVPESALSESDDLDPAPEMDPDLDGVREGMSYGENLALGAIGVYSTLMAPYLYFAFTPLRYQKMPAVFKYISKGMPFLMPGLLDGRNDHMGDAMVEYFEANPDSLPLVRLGDAHIDGMKQVLEEHGSLYCRDVPLSEIYDSDATDE